MSLFKSCAVVPELIYDAPNEIKSQTLGLRLDQAIAVAFLQTYKVGMIVTVRVARGCLLKKLPDGSWSAPCGLMFGGPAIGANFGVEISDMIVFINTEEALKGFMDKSAGLSLSGGACVGPFGRSAEALLTTASPQPVVVYSQSKGIYGGISVEISGIVVDHTANKVEYGPSVKVEDILNGTIARPTGEVFNRMYKALDSIKSTPSMPEPVASEESM